MPTKLAFSTAVGAASIPTSGSLELGKVDVSPSTNSRVVADDLTAEGLMPCKALSLRGPTISSAPVGASHWKLARAMIAVAALAGLARPMSALADCNAVVEEAYQNCKAGEYYNSYGLCENRRAQALEACQHGASYQSSEDIFKNPHDQCLKRANDFLLSCNRNSCMPTFLNMLAKCG